VDAFCAGFVLPKGKPKLDAGFFETRCAASEEGTMRAFAGELLTAVPLLVEFCKRVLQPAGFLPRHVACFLLLSRILALLCSGDKVLEQLEQLQDLIGQHHDLYVQLYPAHVRPKLHYLMHLPGCFREMQCNISCFVCERRHRVVKQLAASCFRHYEHVLTSGVLSRMIIDIQDPHFGCAIQLQSPRPFPEGTDVFGDLLGTELVEVFAATRASIPWAGLVCRADVVTMSLEEGVLAGRVDMFFCVIARGVSRFFVQLAVFAAVGDSRYNPTPIGSRLYDVSQLSGAMMYYTSVDGHLELCLP